MSPKAVFEAHKGIVYLFLTIFFVKVLLQLFAPSLFEKIRAKSKITEMILGPALIGTGLWMWSIQNFATPSWLIIKLIIMVPGIALAIIGLKKGNKVLTLIAVAIFISVYLLAKFKSPA